MESPENGDIKKTGLERNPDSIEASIKGDNESVMSGLTKNSTLSKKTAATGKTAVSSSTKISSSTLKKWKEEEFFMNLFFEQRKKLNYFTISNSSKNLVYSMYLLNIMMYIQICVLFLDFAEFKV